MNAQTESLSTKGALPRTEFVSAVGRAMMVLECFTSEASVRHQGRLTLTDVAKITGLTRGTSRRLLLTLKQINYVDTDGKMFWLTPKLINLSRGFLVPISLGEESARILENLTHSLDESSSVGMLDGGEIVYIERVEVRRIYSSSITNGTRLPAACSSIGRVLLAALSDKDLHNWLRLYKLNGFTDKTITDPLEFWEEIERIRGQGYAINDEELEIGIRSIAVPIMSPSGRTIAALNASTVSARHTREDLIEQFLPKLIEATHELAATIGW